MLANRALQAEAVRGYTGLTVWSKGSMPQAGKNEAATEHAAGACGHSSTATARLAGEYMAGGASWINQPHGAPQPGRSGLCANRTQRRPHMRSWQAAAHAASLLPLCIVVLPPRLVVRPGVCAVHAHALDRFKVLLHQG